MLALILSLPVLPPLGVGVRPPRRQSSNTRVLEKVRALLAKAESTTFPEEAEALSAKAQGRMARHAIDEAMGSAGAGAGARVGDGPTGVRVPVDDPYAGAKSILLSEVAAANRCRAVWSKGLGFSTVLGFEADLEFVDVLYTSLLVQATAAMVAAGSQVDRSGRSRTRSFRQGFLLPTPAGSASACATPRRRAGRRPRSTARCSYPSSPTGPPRSGRPRPRRPPPRQPVGQRQQRRRLGRRQGRGRPGVTVGPHGGTHPPGLSGPVHCTVPLRW